MGKQKETPEVEDRPKTEAPKKAKGLTKKRGRKDRFTAESNTAKRKAARAATIERRYTKKLKHVADWARRNGINVSSNMTIAEARAAVHLAREFPVTRRGA